MVTDKKEQIYRLYSLEYAQRIIKIIYFIEDEYVENNNPRAKLVDF
ncbi:hypothetical protein [Alkaliphilus peptidifermentans]|nr:hypothetical protein [Alkaliphilus peptidifermentans]